jgi:hypothetical protein
MVKQVKKGGLNAESILVPVELLGGQKIVKNYKPNSETSPPEKVVSTPKSSTKSETVSKSVKALSKSTKKGGAIAVTSSQIAVKSNMTPSPSKRTEAPAKKCGKTRTLHAEAYPSLKKGGNGDNSQQDDRELVQEEQHINTILRILSRQQKNSFIEEEIKNTIKVGVEYIYSSEDKLLRENLCLEICILIILSMDHPVYNIYLINTCLYLLAYVLYKKYNELNSLSLANNKLFIQNLLLFAIAEGGFGEYKGILKNKKYFIPMVICGDIIINNKINPSYIPIINEIQTYKKVFLEEIEEEFKKEYNTPNQFLRGPNLSSLPNLPDNQDDPAAMQLYTLAMERYDNALQARLAALLRTGGCKLSKKVKKGGSSTLASDTASIAKSVVAKKTVVKKTVAKKVDNNSDAKNSTHILRKKISGLFGNK